MFNGPVVEIFSVCICLFCTDDFNSNFTFEIVAILWRKETELLVKRKGVRTLFIYVALVVNFITVAHVNCYSD